MCKYYCVYCAWPDMDHSYSILLYPIFLSLVISNRIYLTLLYSILFSIFSSLEWSKIQSTSMYSSSSSRCFYPHHIHFLSFLTLLSLCQAFLCPIPEATNHWAKNSRALQQNRLRNRISCIERNSFHVRYVYVFYLDPFSNKCKE